MAGWLADSLRGFAHRAPDCRDTGHVDAVERLDDFPEPVHESRTQWKMDANKGKFEDTDDTEAAEEIRTPRDSVVSFVDEQDNEIKPQTNESVRSSSPPERSVNPPNGKYEDALKKTTTMLRCMIDSNEADLSNRIADLHERFSTQADEISKLRAEIAEMRNGGGSVGQRPPLDFSAWDPPPDTDRAVESIKEDVQMVIDAMRAEIASIKQSMKAVTEGHHSPRRSTKHATEDSMGDTLSQSPMGHSLSAPSHHGHTGRHHHVHIDADKIREDIDFLNGEVARVFKELENVKDSQTEGEIKTGFLAIAASECSHQDKEDMFAKLREQEEALRLNKLHRHRERIESNKGDTHSHIRRSLSLTRGASIRV